MDFYVCLNQRGFFPGPSEDKATFLKRVATLEKAFREGKEKLEMVASAEWSSPKRVLKKIFGMAPDWMVAFYSNKKLPFWQGAATLIEGDAASIQLRKGIKKKRRYLGLYHRDEILAHELVHAARMAFDEPKYEEVFAYLTSKNVFRRLLGGLFRRPKESLFFLILFCIPSVLVWLRTDKVARFYTFPLAYCGYLFTRLMWTHVRLNRCLSHLSTLFRDPLSLSLRLTDREISLFARLSPEKIAHFIEKEPSFRWQFLRSVFKRTE